MWLLFLEISLIFMFGSILMKERSSTELCKLFIAVVQLTEEVPSNMALLLRGLRNVLPNLRNALFGREKAVLATVAIDLGKTYSGFAFSLNSDEGGDLINRDWVNELGHGTKRTPTCLLLKSDQSFDSFGYQAIEKFTHLEDVYPSSDKFLFFENFKMSFHEDESLDFDMKIEASNGTLVKAITVFAHCIKFLKEEAVKVIREKTGERSYEVEDIQWVLTVPAIWTPTAKQFMREAAYGAGIGSRNNPSQVLIVFDAEAAGLYCATTELSWTQVTAAGDKPGTQYVLADIGGGGMGVVVFENQDDGERLMVYKNTVEFPNGAMINYQFKNALNDLFGAQKMHDYRRLFPYDWLKIIEAFKAQKCCFDNEEIKIQLPGSFVPWVNDFRFPPLKQFAEGEIHIDSYGCLWMSVRVMRKLFQPIVEAITHYLGETVLNKPNFSHVDKMILVGGFAESPHLKQEIKNAFSGRFSVTGPPESSVATVHGAVMFGKKARSVEKRVVGLTYGADCSKRFTYGLHPEENKFIVAGEAKCRDLFNLFVKTNDIIKGSQKISVIYRPREPDETEIRYSFYTADTPDVLLITDPGVTPIGTVVIQSPDTAKGLDRDIEVSLHFVGSDVIATAWDAASGNTAQATLNVYPSPCKAV